MPTWIFLRTERSHRSAQALVRVVPKAHGQYGFGARREHAGFPLVRSLAGQRFQLVNIRVILACRAERFHSQHEQNNRHNSDDTDHDRFTKQGHARSSLLTSGSFPGLNVYNEGEGQVLLSEILVRFTHLTTGSERHISNPA